jgi:DNA-binding CsgD family transcriptional regulator
VVAGALTELGHLALAAGDPTRARSLLAEGLRLSREHESVRGQVRTLAGLAAVAAALGQPRRALRLGGAVAAAGTTTGRPLPPADRAALDAGLARARRALPAAAQAAAWAEGQALPLEAAAAHALAPAPPEACVRRTAAVPAAGGPRPGRPLTRREAQVLRLVAQGHTDRQIAAALGVSEDTVGRHLTHTYRKLGVATRAAASAAAVRHGLA